ncbi:hypothetical protein Y032_0004g1918 [Ancylostoma ceylanicum]|uniref:Uncharacterized protein n=1 Tax=Ancylostoma ceylanicum TaxID=53326 RepID=A0A016VU12_9BILA|nr:hypothetical protein Y032_0004g1918 [Ancylostoma ceylanicum]
MTFIWRHLRRLAPDGILDRDFTEFWGFGGGDLIGRDENVGKEGALFRIDDADECSAVQCERPTTKPCEWYAFPTPTAPNHAPQWPLAGAWSR